MRRVCARVQYTTHEKYCGKHVCERESMRERETKRDKERESNTERDRRSRTTDEIEHYFRSASALSAHALKGANDCEESYRTGRTTA